MTTTTPSPAPDPYIYRCPACGWTGGKDDRVPNVREWLRGCPQCAKLGYTSLVECIPLAKLEPRE